MRIRIQQLKLMRIHADPDPDPDPKPCLVPRLWMKQNDFLNFVDILKASEVNKEKDLDPVGKDPRIWIRIKTLLRVRSHYEKQAL